jgi:hypothetical protein
MASEAMRNVVAWSFLVSLAMLVSGCASGGGDGEEGAEPVLITDPSQNRTSPDDRPHLHDYWGGQDRLTVMDADQYIGGITWYGPPIAVGSFRPESGDVVPQGAAWVNVTISWVDEADNNYADPQLWVKSARDSETQFIGDVPGPEGATFAIPTTNDMNDLPHQVLSAWQFDLMMSGGPNPVPNPVTGDTELTFTGTVSIVVTTDRGLEIPIYPGHPDRWNGATEIELLSESNTVNYIGDPTTGTWACFIGCPVIHVPGDRIVVPYDASEVIVVLEFQFGAPAKLGLKYHAADSREYVEAELISDELNRREYVIPVGVGGDGPYAIQSQWEFAPFVEFPQENGLVPYEEYTITATVHK